MGRVPYFIYVTAVTPAAPEVIEEVEEEEPAAGTVEPVNQVASTGTGPHCTVLWCSLAC